MQDGATILVRYDEAMLRRAVRAFVWRRMLRRRWLWLLAAALLLAGAATGLAATPGFGAGVALAGLVFLLAFVGAVWRAHFVNTVGRFRAMDPPTARCTFGARELVVASNLGSSTIPWSSFVDRWELDGAWLLFLGPSRFLTLPTAELPDAVKDHVRTHVAAAGPA